MALTPDLTTITLTGSYVDIQGNPISGSVTFTPQSIIKDTDQNQIIINQTLTATLDANGSFSIVLPITDDSDVAPQPFAYAVEEVFSGGRTFFITLPTDTPDPQDIADLAPAVSATEAANYVTQAQYNTLLARYTAANAEYTQIGNTGTNLDNVELYADQAATADAETSKAALNQFVLMGM
jgi:hypothetical protein